MNALRLSRAIAIVVVTLIPALAAAAEPDAAAPAIDYGFWSLVPPLVAIVAAVVSRRVLTSLLLGIFTGALIETTVGVQQTGFLYYLTTPFRAAYATLETYLWGALIDPDHLRVFAFTLLMAAMVGVATRSGGMHGLVELLLPLARTRRGGQIVSWLLGLMVFFDDYANTLVLGNTLRPMTDRLKISRAKLAYLVDSTSAPVAGLALVSTWIATEVQFIAEGLKLAGLDEEQKYYLFVASIPSRFYVVWALLTVLLVAWLRRDLGAMLRAEQRAIAGEGPEATLEVQEDPNLEPKPGAPHRWVNAVLPVLVVVGVFSGYLAVEGLEHVDSFKALFHAALAGLAVAVVLVRGQRLLTLAETNRAILAGARTMLPGLAILLLAWSLSTVTQKEHLNLGAYVKQSLAVDAGGTLAGLLNAWPGVLPALVFVVAAFVSFAMGSSWATMGLLVPVSIQVAGQLLGSGEAVVALDHPLLVATVGSVLAGSIFGDHCSPISDTTVLSSQASGCRHLEHVETQLPYALVVGGLSVVGLLLVGVGVPNWAVLPAGIGAVVAILLFFGRDPEAEPTRGA